MKYFTGFLVICFFGMEIVFGNFGMEIVFGNFEMEIVVGNTYRDTCISAVSSL